MSKTPRTGETSRKSELDRKLTFELLYNDYLLLCDLLWSTSQWGHSPSKVELSLFVDIWNLLKELHERKQ
jgi:hypothetical protein